MSWMNQPYQGGYGQPPPGQFPGQQQQQQQQPQAQFQGQPTGYGLRPQPTGYAPQQQQPMQQQPMATSGYGLRPQPTGYAPQQQLQPMATGYRPAQPAYPSSLGYSSGLSTPGLLSNQATGFLPSRAFGGSGAGMQNQFVSSFMPAPNVQASPYMDPAQMQFARAQPGPALQQSFQQSNEQATGQSAVPIPWALEPDEKKRYDQIFRAWDQQGEGFIGGAVAKEVFGQAGLERDDLMDIWNLADVSDRGKLNIDEFHVAMGLIYRRLNGNPIPKTLPPELAPPSARDLNDSVGFLKNLLKHDTNVRSTSGDSYTSGQGSYAKQRSLHENAPPSNRKDATVYRHNDAEATTYKSSSRHIDRDSVRYSGDDSPDADLEDVKKSIQNTRSLVEKSRDRDDEEDDLRDELRDIKRRIERVHDDLEYNLRSGRRTAAKDDEKRKLERELLNLEHEELPRLVRKMEEKERDKKRDKAKFALERDARNNETDRYEDRRGNGYARGGRDEYDRDGGREKGYNRGTYDDEPRDRYERSSRRDPSPPRTRTPPPPPPPAPVVKAAPPPPPPVAAPAPRASPAITTMTAEERLAHRRAEAALKVQERLRALGLAAPSTSSDTSVADRLEQDRQEAAARVAQADKEVAAKDLERQAKLEKERLRGVSIEQSINEANGAKVDQVRGEIKAASAPAAAASAAQEQLDAEDKMIAEREAALEKEKAVRQARLRQLEQDLEEAKEAEENFIKNKAKFAASAKGTSKAPPPPPSRARAAAPPPAARAAPPPVVVEPAPVAAPTPPAVAEPAIQSPAAKSPSTNPFHRLGGAATPAAAAPASNPFFRLGAAAAVGVAGAVASIPIVGALVAPDPAPAPTPAAPKTAYRPPPASDDDWDLPKENDGSDSSEDEDGGIGNRNARQGLASALFGGLISAPARPTSAQAATPSRSSSTPTPAAPRVFAAPPADDTPVVKPMALLGEIQGGLRLKKTSTKDRSTPAAAGAVIGDASAPVQTYVPPPRAATPPRAASPPPAPVLIAPVAEAAPAPTPVAEPEPVAEDALDAVDLTTTRRSRALFAYAGQRDEDLSFEENAVILAHPAKDVSSPWWYGTLAHSGHAGWFPASYVESMENAKPAKALYDYTATSGEELSFVEGDVLSIVDDSEESWWKAEKGGTIALVPATYLELLQALPPSAPAALPIPDPPSLAAEESDDSDSLSSSSDEDDLMDPEQRSAERLRVLEAAGLIVRDAQGVIQESPRRPRRAPPRRPSTGPKFSGVEEAEEDKEEGQEERTEDAYDIWQRVMRDLPPLPSRNSLELPSAFSATFDPPSPALSSTSKFAEANSISSATSTFLSRVAGSIQRSTGVAVGGNGSTGEKEKRVVSAPIAVGVPAGGEVGDRRSVVMGIGSTWSSLIDPSALADIPDQERKRQEAIFELIATESTFLQTLQLLSTHFEPALSPLLSEKALTVIFANLPSILEFSVFFLSELEERQKESRLYVGEIGDVVEGRVRGLEVFRGYCVNRENGGRTLEDLRAGDPVLRQMLEGLKIKGLELSHFLLEPMQRLARYSLLISQILRYTPQDHPDYTPLTTSLKIANQILLSTNESIRLHEESEKLVRLSDELEFDGVVGMNLTAPTRYLGPRRILKSGELRKFKSGRKLTVHLFNDLVLLTELKSDAAGSGRSREAVYRIPIPLEESSLGSHRDDTCFTLSHRGTTLILRAGTARAAKGWRDALEKAREECIGSKFKGRDREGR